MRRVRQSGGEHRQVHRDEDRAQERGPPHRLQGRPPPRPHVRHAPDHEEDQEPGGPDGEARAHVRACELSPRRGGGHAPSDPPRPRLGPQEPRRSREHQGRPCDRGRGRQRQPDERVRHDQRQGDPAERGGRPFQTLAPQQRVYPEPRQDRLHHDVPPDRGPAREQREQEHGGEVHPPGLGIAGEPHPRQHEWVPRGDVARGQALTEEAVLRQDQRQDVAVLVRHEPAEHHVVVHGEHRHNDRHGAGDRRDHGSGPPEEARAPGPSPGRRRPLDRIPLRDHALTGPVFGTGTAPGSTEGSDARRSRSRS